MCELMERLKLSGAAALSPVLSRGELAVAFHRVGISGAFNDVEMEEIYNEIAALGGMWIANEESKEGPETAKALLAIAKSADVASAALAGHETGLGTTAEIQATTLVAESLTPAGYPREPAQQVIAKFRKSPHQIADAALSARRKLMRKSDRTGRDQLVWYDRFTRLLLNIAEKAEVDPTFGKDDGTGVPCGWLFRAASELELFLYPHMRSPSPVACGKRLSRSLHRLGHRR